ncbi:MATE family efflux transporter [Pedobacter jamesrossensis]|uniref:Multidrug-efflux transporter n=1 Tax=Pedobacter jamesrossensis TaxID=1908238 RepID=A0ABV8NQ27_9SPHI
MAGKEEILKDNIWKLMLNMSLPGIGGMLVISLNSFVDAMFAGRYIGSDALAGISLCIPLLVVNSAVTGFISSGSSNILSRAIGSKDETVFRNLFAYTLAFSLVASVVLGVLGYLFSTPLLQLMGATGEILKEAGTYYRLMMAGCFTSIFGLGISSLIRAEGRMKYAMSITTFAVILNIILNAILVIYLRWGVKGSAIATVASMGIFTLLTLRYFVKEDSYVKLNFKKLAYLPNMISDIANVGLSALVMQLNNFLRQVFLFKTVTWYNGAIDTAFFSAVFRIFSFSVIPIFGMLQAMQPIVGINFGAGNLERSIRALNYFRLATIGMMLIALIPLQIFSGEILSLLLPEMNFSAQDIMRFRLLMCILPIAPIASTAVVFMLATKRGKVTTYLALGRELLLFCPLMLLLPFLFGASGIYYGLFLENIIYMIVVILVLKIQVKKLLFF